jgi:hypothetical protein
MTRRPPLAADAPDADPRSPARFCTHCRHGRRFGETCLDCGRVVERLGSARRVADVVRAAHIAATRAVEATARAADAAVALADRVRADASDAAHKRADERHALREAVGALLAEADQLASAAVGAPGTVGRYDTARATVVGLLDDAPSAPGGAS